MSHSSDNKPSAPFNIYVCSYILKAEGRTTELVSHKFPAANADAAHERALREITERGRTLVMPEILIQEIKPTDHYDIR